MRYLPKLGHQRLNNQTRAGLKTLNEFSATKLGVNLGAGDALAARGATQKMNGRGEVMNHEVAQRASRGTQFNGPDRLNIRRKQCHVARHQHVLADHTIIRIVRCVFGWIDWASRVGSQVCVAFRFRIRNRFPARTKWRIGTVTASGLADAFANAVHHWGTFDRTATRGSPVVMRCHVHPSRSVAK